MRHAATADSRLEDSNEAASEEKHGILVRQESMTMARHRDSLAFNARAQRAWDLACKLSSGLVMEKIVYYARATRRRLQTMFPRQGG